MQKVTKSLSVEAARAARKWYVVDANEQVLGRLATRVAAVLRGKHNPAFTPHVDCGDFVVVINADKVRLTGNKAEGKIYYSYSGYPGGIRERTAGEILATRPEEVIRKAVTGMLPRNRLGRQLAKKLKIYTGSEHPHVAQTPAQLSV
ncbi:MAG TPA: 50S ribosomal protein L13 [Candidatus Limnocylindrales bacterium]|nr:50S ribosomal protein L13 [Candidatus Limnocylindrales bacterium]